MPYCEVEAGVQLYFEHYGTGAPIVFVHGGCLSHEVWEQQVYVLADMFHVVTYDLRGHGDSDKPPHGHTFEQFEQDLEALIAHLNLGQVSLVCQGIGGYVGILCALKSPDLLSGLALVSSGGRFVGEDEERGGFSKELWETYLTGMAKNKVKASAQLVDRTFFYKDPGPDVRNAVINIMLKWPNYAMKLLGRDLENIDFDERLGEISVPTLILHGAHDRKQRSSGAKDLSNKISGSRLVIFEESAHNPQLEEVEKFNEVLIDFLSGVSSEDAKSAAQ